MSGYVRNPYTQSVLTAVAKAKPKHVFTNDDKLLEVAGELAQMELKHNDWRAPVFPEADDDTFIAFLIVGNAVNYCFTDFATHQKFDVANPGGKPWEGAFAMFAALKRAMEEGMGILNPEFLARLTPEQVQYIFRHVTTQIPMLSSRWDQLVSLGKTAVDNGIENFADIFREADFYAFRDGKGIVERLVNTFPCYWDESRWNGHPLQFHKRAQLLPVMYHGRAVSSNGVFQPIKDPGNIGPIADYQVPKALRSRGIIYYSPELAEKVDNGIEIPKYSDMENEVRGIGVVDAMDYLIFEVNWIRSKEAQIVMGQLDYLLWKMGRDSEGRHHYTHTTSY